MLYNKQIGQLSILGSSICNLSCSYCYLHNRDTQQFYKTLNEEIQEGWKSGSYIENIRKVYEKIGSDPTLTTRMEIWGGEPLIQIDNLLMHIEQLFELFPNVDFFMIPTNFAWPEYITEKIPKLLSLYDKTRLKNENELHLQLSIDGFDGPILEFGHHADNKQYLKNLEVLIEGVSKLDLKNTTLVLDIHGTASGQNILKYLSTEKDIKAYLDGMHYLKDYASELCSKYKTDRVTYGQNPYYPLCASPENSTVAEGINYTIGVRLAEYVSYKENYLQDKFVHYYENFDHNMYNSGLFTANHQCSESGANALMILPNGTISECACSYVQNRSEYLNLLLENGQNEDYIASLMRKKYFFNPLTATPEEEEFNDWYNLTGLRNTFSTQLNLSMGLCQELALSNQISREYLDAELLLKHLHKECTPYSCTREQIRDTGIPYLGHPGDFRRTFNGEVQYAEGVSIIDKKIKIRNWLNELSKY